MEKKDSSLWVPQRNKIKETVTIRDIQWTENQLKFIDLVFDKKVNIIFLDGCAGTAKTFLSVYCALKALNEKRCGEILYVRTVVESASRSLGFLPGESNDKFKPFTIPLEDKLEELISKGDSDKLFKEERIRCIPVNYLRGTNFNATFMIFDEAQNALFQELTTIVTRVGKFSKLIICGDSFQADINGKSGFKPMMDIFDDEESRQNGIFVVKFTKDDIMRSEVVRFILTKLEDHKINNKK